MLATKATIDLSPMLGTWVNTSPETDHIVQFVATERESAFVVRTYGAGEPDPIDWGEVAAVPCAIEATEEIAGFSATYDFGTVETLLAAYGAKGVLVIQTYTKFKDGSGRPDYFTREFFHQ